MSTQYSNISVIGFLAKICFHQPLSSLHNDDISRFPILDIIFFFLGMKSRAFIEKSEGIQKDHKNENNKREPN